jgi:urease accessory protein
MVSKRFAIAVGLAAAATPAWAHTGAGLTSGFASGFIHPFVGQDHVLAMVTVGLLAVLLTGRARWAVPASFVAMMVFGGGLGVAGVTIPAAEAGILASVAVLGIVVAWGRSLPVGVAVGLAGFFAIFHGYAHGAEMPAGASTIFYTVGFCLATAMLHGAGMAAGVLAFTSPKIVRLTGAAIAVTGMATAIA